MVYIILDENRTIIPNTTLGFFVVRRWTNIGAVHMVAINKEISR